MLSLAAPAGAGEVRTDHFVFYSADGKDAIAFELASNADVVLRSVAAQLGVEGDEQALITVHVVHGDDAFEALMPHSRVTDWAAGVAFPKSSLIILKIDHGTRFDLRDTFRHEISHVALGRAVDHRAMPMWFIEGVAVHQAGEQIRERWSQTATATLTDSVLPLHSLEDRFPADGARVKLAYAQSTSFVTWLVTQHGWDSIRGVIKQMRRGDDFHSAFQATYNAPVEVVEAAWLERISESASWMPLLMDQTLWWVLIALLAITASLLIKGRNRKRLAAMPDHPDDEFA